MLWDPNKDVDLTKPSLKGLSYLLKHKELWPEGFDWNWSSPTHCAMGLCRKQWGTRLGMFFQLRKHSTIAARMLGITQPEAQHLFLNSSWSTPTTIADKIDELIVERG